MRIAGGQNIFVPILQVYNDVTERKKDIMKYRKALTFSYDDGIEQDRKLVEICRCCFMCGDTAMNLM